MPCRVKRRDQGSLFLSACFGGHRGRLTTRRHTHPHPHSHSTPVSIIHHHEDQRKHSGVVKMSKTFKIWLGCPHLPSISLNLWATGKGFQRPTCPQGPGRSQCGKAPLGVALALSPEVGEIWSWISWWEVTPVPGTPLSPMKPGCRWTGLALLAQRSVSPSSAFLTLWSSSEAWDSEMAAGATGLFVLGTRPCAVREGPWPGASRNKWASKED